MRVVLQETSNASTVNACGIYTYGETEDYTINISGGATNPGPPAYTYNWMPGNLSGATPTASPTSTTTYTVTQSDANGCTAVDSITVDVISPTITSLTATPPSVCAGDSTTLDVLPLVKPANFCTPTITPGSGSGDFIDSVGGFGGLLSNKTGANPAPYYAMYPTPVPVSANTFYVLDIKTGTSSGSEYALWIDYNQDSIFTPNEKVGQVFNIAANTIFSFQVNIPTTALNGKTMMRVMCDWAGPNNMVSCGLIGYGEVEDYVLDISGATAPAPYFTSVLWTPATNLNANNLNQVTATNLMNSTNYTVTGTDANGCTVSSSINVVVNSPTGDSYANPIIANALPYVDTNNNLDSNCWTNAGLYANNRASNDVFYEFTMPSCADSVSISLCNTGPSWDTYLFLLDNTGAVVASNDDNCGLLSRIRKGGLTPGATYTAVIEGFYSNGQGSFVLNIDAFEPPISASLALATSNQALIQNDASNLNYRDANCNLITTINDGAGGNVLGSTIATVVVDPTAGMHNGQPFVRRWYQITPLSNGPATVTLYFTQADFDDLNTASVAPYLQLPTMGSNTDPNIPNIRITKNDNAGLGNNPVVLTPTSVNWNGSYWELTVNTPGFSQFRAHAVNPNNAALPVRYTNFTVRKERTVDVVEWTTANEQNNKHFNVQRSANGFDFTTLGTVETKATNGNSVGELSYSFVDQKPMTGHNYYRLEQVDIDDKTNFSEVIDIVWGATGSTVSIYPNPATHALNVDLTVAQAAKTEVRLVDMSGRVVQSVLSKTVKGLNHITINLGDVAKGVYGIQVFENNKLTHVSKLQKN
jgi:hypothetical protein